MEKYIVGQTYKAVFPDGAKHSFEVIEQGHDVYSDVFRIRWEDGYEEYPNIADLDRWVEAAEENQEVQDQIKAEQQAQETAEAIERLKVLRDTYLHNVKALDHAISKLEKKGL